MRPVTFRHLLLVLLRRSATATFASEPRSISSVLSPDLRRQVVSLLRGATVAGTCSTMGAHAAIADAAVEEDDDQVDFYIAPPRRRPTVVATNLGTLLP